MIAPAVVAIVTIVAVVTVMQICGLALRLHYADCIMCILRIALCGLHCADDIVRIASCTLYGLYCVNCIMQIVFCELHCVYCIDCIVWIALYPVRFSIDFDISTNVVKFAKEERLIVQNCMGANS